MNPQVKAYIDGLIDVVAIAALCYLAATHVIDGSAVVPVITLIAGANASANINRIRAGSSNNDGTPPSIPPGTSGFIVALTGSLLAVLRGFSHAAILPLCIALTFFLQACGAGSLQTAWQVAETTCGLVMGLDPKGHVVALQRNGDTLRQIPVRTATLDEMRILNSPIIANLDAGVADAGAEQ